MSSVASTDAWCTRVFCSLILPSGKRRFSLVHVGLDDVLAVRMSIDSEIRRLGVPRRLGGACSCYVLEKMGFQRGRAGPCVLVHPERQIYLTVYVGDFSDRGRKPVLDWFETRMQEAFELTLKGRRGYAKEDHHELCILNRVLRTCPRGVEYEADPRHVEEMIRSMELERCNSVSTPGTKETVDSMAAGEGGGDVVSSSSGQKQLPQH